MLIQAKLDPPNPPEQPVARPRLQTLIGDLIDRTAVVWVCASAGAGKTTAVLDAVSHRPEPVCWLSLDNTDSAPGLLLNYLEATVSRACPEVEAVSSSALAAGAPHPEAAGLLSDAIGDTPVVLVIDQIERIADAEDAMAVIEGFLRYAPRNVRTVLISRREVPLDIASRNWQSAARVGESDLAFTVAETEKALERSSRRHPAAAAAVAATGGWVTGVLFEAWRSSEHVYGAGGEADPLHGYLSTQILAELDDDDRLFLIATAVLDDVTADRAEALGLSDASARLASLKQAHVPATWDGDDQAFRCHPRFREYLLALLDRQPDEFSDAIRHSYANLLTTEGHFEDATERLLELGDLEQALATAENAIVGVVERLDLAIAERWIQAFIPGPGDKSRALAWAELAVAVSQEQFGRAADVADRLRALIGPDAEIDAELAAMMNWAYWFVERYDDCTEMVRRAAPGPGPDILKWAGEVETVDGEGSYDDEPPPYGGFLDALLLRIHWTHGRLDRLLEPQATRWAEVVNRPWKIIALTALGRHEEALQLSDEADAARSGGVHFDAIAKVELLAELGRPAEAWRAHIEGRERIRATGSGFYSCLHLLLEAKLALRLSRNADQARAAIEQVATFPAASNVELVLDEYAAWNGLTYLMEGRHQEAALLLREASQRMRARDRLLHLPSVAVYLAEAEWRLGNEDASDEAADLALVASGRLGSNHLLLLALADFPAVAARRIDAEPEADSPWQAIGRSLLHRGVAVETTAATQMHLRDLGKPCLEFGGESHRPRIAKSLELLSYLLHKPGLRASRQDILGALFDGRDDRSARSYLRQAVARLREALPEDDLIGATPDEVWLTGPLVSSDSARLRKLLSRSMESNDEVIAALPGTLDLAARGEFLEGHSSVWIDDIRRDLADSVGDLRLRAAELLFADGDYAAAQSLVVGLLGSDPLRESAWRLRMRISNALGDDDEVISTYRRCQEALARVGLEPAESTRKLIDQLRR